MHLSVSWQDFSTLAKNGYLYDDSFYAFKIAQNIVAGNGATFDGTTPTPYRMSMGAPRRCLSEVSR